MAMVAAFLAGGIVVGALVWLYGAAARRELRHLRKAAEQERDRLKLDYQRLVARLEEKAAEAKKLL